MDIESIKQKMKEQLGDDFDISSTYSLSDSGETLVFRILHDCSVIADRLEVANSVDHTYEVSFNFPIMRSAGLSDETIDKVQNALSGLYLKERRV